ncbi:MAG: septum formation initiator family protein [Fibrobacteraceae bacterium]
MRLKKVLFQFAAVLVFALCAASLWHFTMGENGFWNQYKLSRQISILKQESDSLKTEIEFREAEGKRLLNDSFYIESIARTRYGMSRPGEKVFQFVHK